MNGKFALTVRLIRLMVLVSVLCANAMAQQPAMVEWGQSSDTVVKWAQSQRGRYQETEFGAGYHKFTGKYHPACVEYKTPGVLNSASNELDWPIPIADEKRPSKKEFFRFTGSSAEDFESAQTSSVKVSGEYGAFKGSASRSISNRLARHQYAAWGQIGHKVSYGVAVARVRDLKLSDRGQDLVINMKEFRLVCGDAFVIGAEWGSNLSIVYTMHSKDEKKVADAHTALNAAVNTYGGSAEANAQMSSHLQKVTQSENFEATILHDAISEKLPTDTNKYADFAAELAVKNTLTPIPIRLIFAPYESLTDFPIVSAPNLSRWPEYLEKLYKTKSKLEGVKDGTYYPQYFNGNRLSKEIRDIDHQIRSVEEYMLECETECPSTSPETKALVEFYKPDKTILSPSSSAQQINVPAEGGVLSLTGRWFIEAKQRYECMSADCALNRFDVEIPGHVSEELVLERPCWLPSGSRVSYSARIDNKVLIEYSRQQNRNANPIEVVRMAQDAVANGINSAPRIVYDCPTCLQVLVSRPLFNDDALPNICRPKTRVSK